MTEPVRHPLTMDGRDPSNLRGDAITDDRYYSAEFAQKEWDQLWTRIWHVAGRTAELEEPGDYVVHNFMKESVICIKQDDGSVKAFYNSCGHRGMRMVKEASSSDSISCPYHGWRWGKDGMLQHAQDIEDFPQGNPCGKLRLRELRCDIWGGFVWYSMDENGPSLAEYLHPLPEVYKNYPMDTAIRVAWYRIALNANWKFVTDNFNEAYHIPAVHPQFMPMIDDHYSTTIFEMYPTGHNRMIEKLQPSSRTSDKDDVQPLWADVLRAWDLGPR